MPNIKFLKNILILSPYFLLLSCFKNPYLNQYALIHEEKCIKYLEESEYAKAKTHCEICLEYDSSHPECLNGLGLIALFNKDEERAKLFFHKAVRQNNDFTQAINNLGVIEFQNTNFAKADKFFTKALKIDPGNLDARYNSALSNLRLYQKTSITNNSNAKHYLLKAKENIEKILVINNEFNMAYRELGLAELYLSKEALTKEGEIYHLKSALKAFDSCVQQNALLDLCHEGLGEVQMRLGNFFDSWKSFFVCLSSNSSNIACKEGIVLAYEKSVQEKNAQQSFENILKTVPKNADTFEAYCHILFEKGFLAEGATQCKNALKLEPKKCPLNYKLANYYSKIAHMSDSKSYCKQYLLCTNQAQTKEIKFCEDIIANKVNG